MSPHDDDLGPDIYDKGHRKGFLDGQKHLWKLMYDRLYGIFPYQALQYVPGGTSTSDQRKGQSVVDNPAERPASGDAFPPPGDFRHAELVP